MRGWKSFLCLDNKKQDPHVPVWEECPFEILLLLKHPSLDWLKLANGAESSEHICLYIIHVEKSFQTLWKKKCYLILTHFNLKYICLKMPFKRCCCSFTVWWKKNRTKLESCTCPGCDAKIHYYVAETSCFDRGLEQWTCRRGQGWWAVDEWTEWNFTQLGFTTSFSRYPEHSDSNH